MDRTVEVLGLFLCCGLRLGIPISITLLLAWGLKRLDAHWQAEAEAKATQTHVKTVALSQTRCWDVHNCSPQNRQNCPAYARPDTPCWEVFRSNGHLQERCRDCGILSRALAVAGG